MISNDKKYCQHRDFVTQLQKRDLYIGGSKGRGGVLRGLQPPFQISKIKESNKTKQKIEDDPLEKEEERKSCMLVLFLCVYALIRVSTNIFLSKFSSLTSPLKNILIRACNILGVTGISHMDIKKISQIGWEFPQN